jgi:uncharacterized membrane protein
MELIPQIKLAVAVAGHVAELIGVAVILLGVVVALVRYGAHPHTLESDGAYDRLRRELGRAIIVGLEFLVAAEVVRTVVIERTLENMVVLAVVVLIRTLLSFALFVEVEGRWPWQRLRGDKGSSDDDVQGERGGK